MFVETGCVPGIDGEQVPAESLVPDAKEYISRSVCRPFETSEKLLDMAAEIRAFIAANESQLKAKE